MKKIIKNTVLALLVTSGSLLANSGEVIYQSKCVACHQIKGMMDMSQMQEMRKKMQTVSVEERQTLQQEMKSKMKKSGMRAPAMNMVSMRLKMKISSKEEFVGFVKDYIQNPSQEKGYCMPMAYKRFGTMPPIGKGMSAEEREIIALWLYENFNDSWRSSKDAKMCNSNNKPSMKCGAGK